MRRTTTPSSVPAGFRAAAGVLFALVLAACGTTPPTSFYTLTPLAAAPGAGEHGVEAGAGGSGAPIFGLAEVDIPDVVDRPQFVLSVSEHERRFEEFVRWAEPLDATIGRVLSENLSVLLAPTRVVHRADDLGLSPATLISVAIVRFDVNPGGACVLDARWTTRGPPGSTEPALLRSGSFQCTAESSEPGALAAGMSRNLLELSRAIAAPLVGSAGR